MSKIDKEEVIKMATLSGISIEKENIDTLIGQLESVLNYAERVIEIAADTDESLIKTVNIVREDIVMPFDAKNIIQEAPEKEHNYFVVPKIVDGAR